MSAPVDSFPANLYGLHDMPGNVWEWVEDDYDNYPDHHTDTKGLIVDNSRWRVLRGSARRNKLNDLGG